MSATSQSHQPSPEKFLQGVNAFQLTAALKAAVELDLFTAIGEGEDTSAALAQRCRASERGMRILCDSLVVYEFLTKENGKYALTADSAAFLDGRSPMCIGPAVNFLAADSIQDGYRNLTEVVRRGGTVIPDGGNTRTENPLWVEFARSMAPLMILPAELIAGMLAASAGARWKILDIAAGHGLFGVTLARHNPNAEIYAADWPNVLEVAKENAANVGVTSRYHTIPGDAFQSDLGKDYDLALLTNFLHHFDPATNENFLRKVHAALKPGGRAITLEFVPNEDRVSPPMPASFSMIMLGTTPSGDAYTFAELERMFRNAGFASSEFRPLPPTMQSVILSSK